MKTRFIESEFAYDGTQLSPLYNYLNHTLLGDSVIAWIGPCAIDFAHMVDGEDLLAKAEIKGSKMLHFIFELFHTDLKAAVALQRLFASQAKDLLEQKSQLAKAAISREGDDLYYKGGKLSISIATLSVNSSLIHFAVNISNEGTPVKTSSLSDLQVDAKQFALELLKKFSDEYHDIQDATCKVRTL